jgi:O-antigen ligase
MISGLIYVDSSKNYINEFIKYFILIFCGAELARETSSKEMCIFLLLGATSILAHAIVFTDDYGRYSGFYLNPNGAAFICLIGYCLTFNIKQKTLKYVFIFIFTFAGAITFSRFFFLMWLIITFVSIYGERKNIQLLGIGVISIVLLISVATILQVNTERFAMLEGLLDENKSTNNLTNDARLSSWAKYYKDILMNPIFGNGFKSFSGADSSKQGVHNTYLMVIGEAGIIPLFLILGIYLTMMKKAYKLYKTDIHKLLLAISLTAILTTMHNYFNNEVIIFTTIWLYVKLEANYLEEAQQEYNKIPL